MPIQLPSLFYDVARMPAVAVGLPLAFGMLNGRITKTSVNTWYPSQSPLDLDGLARTRADEKFAPSSQEASC